MKSIAVAWQWQPSAERRLNTPRVPPARLQQSYILTPGQYYCVFGKVNSADEFYLVIESVKADNKHQRLSTAPVPADGAGGIV